MRKELIGISKFLSLVLRHDPKVIGLVLDEQGWANVDDLINKVNTCGNKNLTKKTLDEIVATNEKKRFAYDNERTRIRASQGHSIDVDLKLKQLSPPEYLYHGTADRFLESIKKEGLKKMSRNHVHMNTNPDDSFKVGTRHGKSVVLKIRAQEMEKDGFKFFISENNVWLTEEVPWKYIEGIR